MATSPSSAVEALGLQDAELLSHGAGGKVARVPAAELLQGKHVALYFSASWCPPCRAFTPTLAEVYAHTKAKGLEVILISGDKSEKEFTDYFGKMPWAALPFEDRAAAERLNTLFGVYGIPRLVIVGPDGEVVAGDARGAVVANPGGFPWRGAAGPTFLEQLLTPRGLNTLFLFLWMLSRWFSGAV